MLSGVRVLSFTHFLQGPSASQLLADLGADVIKIEPPKGAFERSWSAPDAYLDKTSVFFLIANRNMRSLAIDLKDPEAAAVLDDLITTADVLIESFRPGAMDRLGLGAAKLRERHPGLIYCSLSGYGSDGPYVDRPGQDVLLQGMSGLAAANGRDGDPATPVGASLIDQHAAVLAAMGILAALHRKRDTGEGTVVQSNLLSAALDLQIEPLGYHLNGFAGVRSASGISSQYYKAPYGVFATADRPVCLSLNSLATLAATFADPWFSGIGEENSWEYREKVNERVAGHLTEHGYDHWATHFDTHGVWYAPVNDYTDVAEDPQVRHNRSIVEFDHPDAGHVRVLGHPVSYDGARPGVRTPPPRLGEHTQEILESVGYSEERVARLVASGVVRHAD